MPTRYADFGYGQTHPGRTPSISPASVHAPPGNPFHRMAFNPVANQFGKVCFTQVGGGHPYVAAMWTETKTGTSAAIAAATNGGILQTCGSTSTFNTNSQSLALWTPVVNTWVNACAVVQTSDITTVGFEFNIGTSAVDPDTTNYTDVVGFKMAVGAGTIVGKVRGNSGTQSATSTLYTATAATDLFVGLSFNLGIPKPVPSQTVTTGASSATQTLSNTADIKAGDVLYFATSALYGVVSSVTNATTVVLVTSISTTTAEVVTMFRPEGSFWIGQSADTAVQTAFSAAQIIQLGAIMTTPLSMYMNLSAKGSAATPTVLWRAASGQVDSI